MTASLVGSAATLVVAEVFGPTLQGEGPSGGRAAMFVRLGRCNLDCSWCDTPYTWDWDHFDPAAELQSRTVAGIVAELEDIAAPMLVVTGGEPLLQQRNLALLLQAAQAHEWRVEVETNGTIVPSAEVAAAVDGWNVSPKLANASIDLRRRLRPEALRALVATGRAVGKFVVTGPADLDEVAEVVELAGFSDVWVMPEARDHESLARGLADLAPAVIARGWNLSNRLHVQLWGDARSLSARLARTVRRVHCSELQTPALVVDAAGFDFNLTTMATALPGLRLRPHVKAHKTTAIAARQAAAGHTGFTCATIREVEGMAAAGLGADLLLANEVVDARRLGAVTAAGSRVTLAVDSDATVDAAAAGGVREVVIDVNVGLPRCGCDPADAGRLADRARQAGLGVRGVMGYEGHLMTVSPTTDRAAKTQESMALLLRAHADVGGDVVSGGGTGTYAVNTWVTEIQAGSYVLMDTAYGGLDLPFRQALFVEATVISSNPGGGFAVADCGLKALGMDHGDPAVEGGTVWYCSDEHVTFSADPLPRVGERVRVIPAHVDPTVAYHERMHVIDAEGGVVETWPVDLRGW